MSGASVASAAQELPSVRVIATGGTIAGVQDYGYKSGAYDVDTPIGAG